MAHALNLFAPPRLRSGWLAAAVASLCLAGTAARAADALAVPCAGGWAAVDADDFLRNSARGIFRYMAGLAAEVLPGR